VLWGGCGLGERDAVDAGWFGWLDDRRWISFAFVLASWVLCGHAGIG
jgi:hypothetical protein